MVELFDAIKNDDIIKFSSIVQEKNNINICFGRFPILSVCFLYNSKKIISKFEKELLLIKEYNFCKEPLELYKKLFSYAKKEARIYAGKNVLVTPIEVLYIMGKMEAVNYIYPYYKDNLIAMNNLRAIEKIRSQKQLQMNDRQIFTVTPKLSKRKKKICIEILVALIVMVMVSACFSALLLNIGIGTEKYPVNISNSQQFATSIKGGLNHIVLTDDFVVEKFSLNEYSGVIDGNGKTITINKMDRPLFQEFKGTLKNLKIVYNIENQLANDDLYGLCEINSGVIENVEIMANANFKVDGSAQQMRITFGVKENYGTIKNVISKGEINIEGNGQCDAMFAAICDTNKNIIQNSQSEMTVNAIDCDIAGICISNDLNGQINDCKNSGQLKQTSNSENWSPNAGGISLYNYGKVQNCLMDGAINLENFKLDNNIRVSIIAGGVVANNYSEIVKCKTSGKIDITSHNSYVYAGGISAIDNSATQVPGTETFVESFIDNCISLVEMTITSNTSTSIYAIGGISGIEEAILHSCCIDFNLKLDIQISSSTAVYIGNVCGYITDEIYYAYVLGQYYIGNNHYVLKDNIAYSVGRIESSSFGAKAYSTIDELINVTEYWQ